MDNQIKLRDGRSLGYAEYGDPTGKPIFFFHGWPGSRFSGRILDSISKKMKLRIISPDRPGRGLSDHQPNRTLLNWSDDIKELSQQLNVKKFSVIGVSGGGPYALVVAYKLPKHVLKVGVISGLGPINPPSQYASLTFRTRFALHALMKFNFLSFLICWFYDFGLALFPRTILWLWSLGKPNSDKARYISTVDRQMYIDAIRTGLRFPSKGACQDAYIYTYPWKFELNQIKTTVYIWHGELDRNVPVWMATYMAHTLPNCQAIFYPEMGHFLFGRYKEDILKVFI